MTHLLGQETFTETHTKQGNTRARTKLSNTTANNAI